MKFIIRLIICFLIALVPSCKKQVLGPCDVVPEYKVINDFSKKIRPETGLVLTGYGINNFLPKEYQFVNGVASFSASYYLIKNRDDEMSLAEARNLIVSLAEGLLNEINTNTIIRPAIPARKTGTD